MALDGNGVTVYEHYGALSISTICCTLSLIMSVHLCYSIATKMKKRLSMLYFLSVLSSTLALWNGGFRYYSNFFYRDNLLLYEEVDIYGDIFNLTASNLFYLIALKKLQSIFVETVYAIHTETASILTMLWSLQTLCSLWYTVSTFHSFFHQHATTNTKLLGDIDLLSDLPIVCMLLFSWILSVFLLAIYVGKLTKTIWCMDAEPMIDEQIKHSVLFGMALFANPLFYVTLFLVTFTSYNGSYMFISKCFINMSTICALYLCVGFNHRMYTKLCKATHERTRMCCLKTQNCSTSNTERTSIGNDGEGVPAAEVKVYQYAMICIHTQIDCISMYRTRCCRW